MSHPGPQQLPCPPPQWVWEQPPIRAAVAARDISTLYRLLTRLGYSQQRIAAMVGQSQPEVSAILRGRKVMAYDVLSRIAGGLHIPRGYMGLAYTHPTDPTTAHTADKPAGTTQPANPPDRPPAARAAGGTEIQQRSAPRRVAAQGVAAAPPGDAMPPLGPVTPATTRSRGTATVGLVLTDPVPVAG
jgi:transcriptional regulator with XRE-family HTH domain